MLQTMMRLAIPPNDYGSRTAIQYAYEIAEALAVFGIVLVKTPDYLDTEIDKVKISLDRDDGPMVRPS